MAEFFDFSIWCVKEFVTFLFGLPFMPQFNFGYVLLAVTLLAVVITALVSSLKVANLSGEASSANAADRRKGG